MIPKHLADAATIFSIEIEIEEIKNNIAKVEGLGGSTDKLELKVERLEQELERLKR